MLILAFFYLVPCMQAHSASTVSPLNRLWHLIGSGYDMFHADVFAKSGDPGLCHISRKVLSLPKKTQQLPVTSCPDKFLCSSRDMAKSHKMKTHVRTQLAQAKKVYDKFQLIFSFADKAQKMQRAFGVSGPRERTLQRLSKSGTRVTDYIKDDQVVTVSTFPTLAKTRPNFTLNAELVRLACSLPETYDKDKAVDILKKFGTHVVFALQSSHMSFKRQYRFNTGNQSEKSWENVRRMQPVFMFPLNVLLAYELDQNFSLSTTKLCLISFPQRSGFGMKERVFMIQDFLERGLKDYATESTAKNAANSKNVKNLPSCRSVIYATTTQAKIFISLKTFKRTLKVIGLKTSDSSAIYNNLTQALPYSEICDLDELSLFLALNYQFLYRNTNSRGAANADYFRWQKRALSWKAWKTQQVFTSCFVSNRPRKQAAFMAWNLAKSVGSHDRVFKQINSILQKSQRTKQLQTGFHCAIIHKVRRGQTLEFLAKKFGLLPETIIADNGLSNHQQIKYGQLLSINVPLS